MKESRYGKTEKADLSAQVGSAEKPSDAEVGPPGERSFTGSGVYNQARER